ncbi:hypothetical protein LDENG_00249640 [Lucifuga dentata]|nr:hypothetical protein LDENG_00249640 [Lucifuga dentata]
MIRHLRSQFARHGIPEVLISDNAPQFSSDTFKRFSVEWGFQHMMSSPHFPQSNGLAERGVQTVKSMLKKIHANDGDPYLALLNLRNTPLEDVGVSPAQLLMGRRLRTKIPATSKQLMLHS